VHGEDQERCETCPKPHGGLQKENMIALEAWRLSSGARSMTGELDIPTVYTVLYQIGGAQEDLDSVLEIDRIFQDIAKKHRKQPMRPGRNGK